MKAIIILILSAVSLLAISGHASVCNRVLEEQYESENLTQTDFLKRFDVQTLDFTKAKTIRDWVLLVPSVDGMQYILRFELTRDHDPKLNLRFETFATRFMNGIGLKAAQTRNLTPDEIRPLLEHLDPLKLLPFPLFPTMVANVSVAPFFQTWSLREYLTNLGAAGPLRDAIIELISGWNNKSKIDSLAAQARERAIAARTKEFELVRKDLSKIYPPILSVTKEKLVDVVLDVLHSTGPQSLVGFIMLTEAYVPADFWQQMANHWIAWTVLGAAEINNESLFVFSHQLFSTGLAYQNRNIRRLVDGAESVYTFPGDFPYAPALTMESERTVVARYLSLVSPDIKYRIMSLDLPQLETLARGTEFVGQNQLFERMLNRIRSIRSERR
jgi:hypothetical protein